MQFCSKKKKGKRNTGPYSEAKTGGPVILSRFKTFLEFGKILQLS